MSEHFHQALVVARSRSSVVINGIAVPLHKAIERLAVFCRPVLLLKDTTGYGVAFSGSSILFRTDNENYMLFSAHQLKGIPGEKSFDPQNVVIAVRGSDGFLGVPPKGMRRPKTSIERDRTWDDVILVEFERTKDDISLDPFFLQYEWGVKPSAPEVGLKRLRLCFAIGYPKEFTDYNMTFDDDWMPISLELRSRWCAIFLRPRPRQSFDLDTRIPFEQDPRLMADLPHPDGLSGSPVFSVYEAKNGSLEIGIMGIITHSDGLSFQVYDSGNLRAFITTLPR